MGSQSMTNNPSSGRNNKNSLTKNSTAENSKSTKQGNLKIAKQETSITAKRENSKVSKQNRQNKNVGAGRITDEPVRVSKSRMSLEFQTGTDFPPLEDHPSFSIDKRKNSPSKRDSKQVKQSSTGQKKNLRVSFEQPRKPK